MNDTPTPKENCETCHGLGRVDAVYAHCPNCVLTAAREEIKELNDKLDDAVADATNAVNDIIRIKWQRDRLAEALEEIKRTEPANHNGDLFYPRYTEDGDWAGDEPVDPYGLLAFIYPRISEALQSLNQPEPESKDPHRFCRGGGGNNFHCGCKYDG